MSLQPDESITSPEINLVSEVHSQILTTYPFLTKEEADKFNSLAQEIEKNITKSTIEKLRELTTALNNPHAGVSKKKTTIDTMEKNSRKIPTTEMVDNVLLLKIPTFQDLKGEMLTELFDKSKETNEGVIIDLRGNGGGQEESGRALAQRLMKKGTYQYGTNWAIGSQKGLHARPCMFTSDNETPYDKPIVLLIDGECFSSCERFIATMKAATTCVTIGTETRGGSGNPLYTDVDIDGETYVVKIPTWRYFLPNETRPIEETKIKPDIPYDKEDVIGYAIKYIIGLKKQPN